MKFSAIVLSAVFGLSAFVAAVPQAASTTSAPAAPVNTAGLTPAQSTALACEKNCNAGDVYCIAQCQGLPVPDATAINATHNCIAACPQGDGTAADNAAYAACEQGCISSLYYTASSAWPTYTGAGEPAGVANTAAAVSASATASTTTGSTGTTSSNSTGTSGTSAPTHSGNAASSVVVSTPFFAAVGFLIAALAL